MLFLSSSFIWSQSPTQITQGAFKITKSQMNEVNTSSLLKKNKAFTVFYYEPADSVMCMANVWKKVNTQSWGSVKVNGIYTKKSETTNFKKVVYLFEWKFQNSYNDEAGILDAIFVKTYKPNGTYAQLYMKEKNDNLVIYEGYLKKDYNLEHWPSPLLLGQFYFELLI
jgi:hypothetical protein